MKKAIVNKAVVIILIIMLLTLSACWNKDELKIHFGYQGTRLPPVMSAARADRSEFNIHDITLDFYFGGHISSYDTNSDRVMLGLGLFFCNSKYYYDVIRSYVEDYLNIDNLYFVRLIPEEEFNSDQYSVSQTLLFGKKFSHNERLTVPQEVIELTEGSFCILFVQLTYLNKEDVICFEYADFFAIGYKRIDSETVRLFNALASPPEYPK